jgi:hypothetical protein
MQRRPDRLLGETIEEAPGEDGHVSVEAAIFVRLRSSSGTCPGGMRTKKDDIDAAHRLRLLRNDTALCAQRRDPPVEQIPRLRGHVRGHRERQTCFRHGMHQHPQQLGLFRGEAASIDRRQFHLIRGRARQMNNSAVAATGAGRSGGSAHARLAAFLARDIRLFEG